MTGGDRHRKAEEIVKATLLLLSVPLGIAWGLGCARAGDAAAPVGPLQEAYYSVEIGGKLIGYATVTPAGEKEWNGQKVEAIQAETVLKIKMLGQEKELSFRSETFLQPGTATPVFYHVTRKQGAVSQEVECEITPEQVRTWTFASGAERGQPQEMKWGPGQVLLDGNNFAHLALLARTLPALDRATTVTTYIPTGPPTEEITLTPTGQETVAVPGGTRTCAVLESQKGDLKLYLDPADRTLVQVAVPTQDAVIRLSDEHIVKLAQKVQAEEVLARHFCQANVTFDSFLDVTYVKADLDVKVIGEGVANAPAVLTNAMQTFTGRKEKDHVTGTVEVRTRTYHGDGAPPLPYSGPDRAEVEPYLKPATMIESDDPAIAAQAKEITQGAADSWEATKRVAQWVNGHLTYEIADTPSAKLALKTRKGDCGPHATLTIAMLRAVGVPARLVGGLCYSPSFGGSWGQHGWVEVYLGPQPGWVALDPTTGEYEGMNAGHLKLFEGMGGVLPTSVKVVAFEPPNQTAPPSKLGGQRETRPMPWKLGQEYRYRYAQGGQALGTETFTITQVKHNGQAAYQVVSKLDLKVGGQTVGGTQTLMVAPNAQPLEFHDDMNAAGMAYQLDCTFKPGSVSIRVRKPGMDLTKDIPLPENVYCFDNNFLGAWAVICPQLTYKVGEKINIVTYHPSSTQQIPLTVDVQGTETVSIGGTNVECFKCFLPQIKNTYWITRDGRFVKAQQGAVVIELEAL
jgi:transglutaminase-like putative cysteine protease